MSELGETTKALLAVADIPIGQMTAEQAREAMRGLIYRITGHTVPYESPFLDFLIALGARVQEAAEKESVET